MKNLQLNGVDIDNLTLENLTSDAFEMCYNHAWALQIALSGDDGVTTVTLEGSNNSSNWDILPNSENITINNNDSVSFFGAFFSFRYLRIVVSTTATIGTISTDLMLKANG